MKVTIILEKKNREQSTFPIKINVGAGNGKQITIPTNCHCSEKNFVGKIGGEIVRRNTPNYTMINTVVNALYFEVATFAMTHTLEELKEKYKPQKAKITTATLAEVASDYCNRSKKNTANLAQYSVNLAIEYKGKDFDINEINIQFVKKFDDFLKQKGLSINTVKTIHGKLATLINRAIDNELYRTHTPYRKSARTKRLSQNRSDTLTFRWQADTT